MRTHDSINDGYGWWRQLPCTCTTEYTSHPYGNTVAVEATTAVCTRCQHEQCDMAQDDAIAEQLAEDALLGTVPACCAGCGEAAGLNDFYLCDDCELQLLEMRHEREQWQMAYEGGLL
jgi:hypothetical protein